MHKWRRLSDFAEKFYKQKTMIVKMACILVWMNDDIPISRGPNFIDNIEFAGYNQTWLKQIIFAATCFTR